MAAMIRSFQLNSEGWVQSLKQGEALVFGPPRLRCSKLQIQPSHQFLQYDLMHFSRKVVFVRQHREDGH
jgi:hypothetical protein